jgi:hypothetical protein
VNTLRRIAARPWLVILLLSLVGSFAWGRPGGGGSFSGGGGGGGDDTFVLELIFLVLELTIDYPEVGIPLVGAIIFCWIIWKLWQSDRGKIALGVVVAGGIVALCIFLPKIGIGVAGAAVLLVAGAAIAGSIRRKPPDWTTKIERAAEGSMRITTPRRQLESLRKSDPDFSLVVLEDFLDALYREVQYARGNQQLDQYAPYLKPAARGVLRSELQAVKDVIVGAMHICTYDRANHRVHIDVEYEANFTEVSRDGKEQAYYVRDRWSLSRRPEAKSRPPDKARIFKCPACGAALESIQGGTCTYCKQQVDTGDYDWIVEQVRSTHRELRGPMLTEAAPEVGTDKPTIVDADLKTNLAALLKKDPQFSEDALAKRIRLIFETMQTAWSNREWLKARPYLSDRLFQTQLYWIHAYKKAKLFNRNVETGISRVELVRVSSDAHFDGITVRLYAQGLDYTEDESGKLICGSKSRPRKYSEYWTLIRGAKVTGPPRVDPICPNCAAPLEVTMAGNCAHCKARVTLGEFDWVLSRIEQDEVYGG